MWAPGVHSERTLIYYSREGIVFFWPSPTDNAPPIFILKAIF